MNTDATARQTLPTGQELDELLLRKLGPDVLAEIEAEAEARVAARYERCPSCGGWREKGASCGS
jgi:hypothetical protein